MTGVAESLTALDAAWFSQVLGEPVTTVESELLAVRGAVGDMARFRLRGSHGGEQTVIGKVRGSSPVQAGMDAAMGLYAREARFYAELAPKVPIDTPRVLYVGDGTTTPLLLEDLGGLRIADQSSGLSVEDMGRLMDALADLHAMFWKTDQATADWLANPAEANYVAIVTQIVSSGVPALRERFADVAPASVLDGIADLAPQGQRVLRSGCEGPLTVAHNDARGDNIFFRPDGTPVFVDWQAVASARGTQDVANLLAGSMDVADLSANWESLLRRYHDRLRERGVRDYPWSDCVLQYRQNVLYPLGAGIALLGGLAIGDGRGLGEAIAHRALSHVVEPNSLEAL